MRGAKSVNWIGKKVWLEKIEKKIVVRIIQIKFFIKALANS